MKIVRMSRMYTIRCFFERVFFIPIEILSSVIPFSERIGIKVTGILSDSILPGIRLDLHKVPCRVFSITDLQFVSFGDIIIRKNYFNGRNHAIDSWDLESGFLTARLEVFEILRPGGTCSNTQTCCVSVAALFAVSSTLLRI